MAKTTKTTNSSTNAADAAGTTAPVVHSENAGAQSSSQDSAGANSSNTPESDHDAGTGNAAGPAGIVPAAIALLVEQSGCADPMEMVQMANLGLAFRKQLDELGVDRFPLISSLFDPLDALPALCDRIAELEHKVAFGDAPAAEEGKRGFITLKQVRHDGIRIPINKPLWLDSDEHTTLALADVVDRDWNNGVRS